MPEVELDNFAVKKSWRELLGTVPNLTLAAKQIGVTYNTLRRWINGEVTPNNPKTIKRITLVNIPGLEESLREDFPNVFDEFDEFDEFDVLVESNEDVQLEVLAIPSAYFLTVIGIRASVASLLLQYTVHNYVYDCIVSQIDPFHVGLVLLFAQCVHTTDPTANVTQLSITSGHGTSTLWSPNQIEHAFQIGKDSLCGVAVASGNLTLYPQMFASEIAPPLLHSESINSAIAIPITLYGDYVAGALFVASIDVEFFTLARRNLLRGYANMMALGLKDDQFYAHDRIRLI